MVKLSVNYERTSVCVFKKLKHSFVWRKHETQITLLHARKGEREREREWNIIQGEGGKEENVGGKEWK